MMNAVCSVIKNCYVHFLAPMLSIVDSFHRQRHRRESVPLFRLLARQARQCGLCGVAILPMPPIPSLSSPKLG
jgi:hypothetical protein